MTDPLTCIGRYQLVAPIGQGGMGALYRAWDPQLGRHIAIKVLVRDDPELRQRFAREARSAASLRHPNIVTIHDVGDHEGQPFIAMEYIQGVTLAKIIQSKQLLTTVRKIELMEELCTGLAFAHQAGIVHRDVKPANLIVSTEGQLKILDFGLARVAEAEGMTQTGMLVGTLNYMSPEQMASVEVDSRSDIFAVGAVFYELLSYQQAFPGDVAATIFHGILYGAPTPLATHDPELEPELIQIVARAMEKEPENRYQDLVTMGTELRRVRTRLQSTLDDAANIPTVLLAPDAALVPTPPPLPPPVLPQAPAPQPAAPQQQAPQQQAPQQQMAVPQPKPAAPWRLLTIGLLFLVLLAIFFFAVSRQQPEVLEAPTPSEEPLPQQPVTPPPPPAIDLSPPSVIEPPPSTLPPPPPRIEEPPSVTQPPPPPVRPAKPATRRPAAMPQECVKLLERLSLGEELTEKETAFLKRRCRNS